MPSGKNNRPSVELQDRDLAIFRGLFESRLMTLEHITRLYFAGRSEAAKKRIQGLKSTRYLGERSRRVCEPSILYLRERAFIELSERGEVSEFPRVVEHSSVRGEWNMQKHSTPLTIDSRPAEGADFGKLFASVMKLAGAITADEVEARLRRSREEYLRRYPDNVPTPSNE